jgi:hypothetical protein
MVDFRNHREARRWLRRQPREVSVAIAARAAARVLPMLARSRGRLPAEDRSLGGGPTLHRLIDLIIKTIS